MEVCDLYMSDIYQMFLLEVLVSGQWRGLHKKIENFLYLRIAASSEVVALAVWLIGRAQKKLNAQAIYYH
jgi:hypothetical protein